MDALYLVAGLGNPGAEYAFTRHNAGFLAVDAFAAKCGADWKPERSYRSDLCRVAVGSVKAVLCKPRTFMNRSGDAIASLAGFYKVPPPRILVLVDDADLPFGQIRLRGSGSSGGHHGLESIENQLGSRDFARLRIGIGRTERGLREITGHVLGRFGPEEQELLGRVLDRAAAQVECYLTEGLEKAMCQFNGVVSAPSEKDKK